MSSASTNAFKYVTRTIEGTEYKLGKLTPRDRQKILDRLKDARKEKLKANLLHAGMDSAGVLTELESFDNNEWGQEQWIGHVNTPAGQDDVVQVAWSKHNQGEFPFFEAMDWNESFKLMVDLTGLSPAPREDETKSSGPTQGAMPLTTPTALPTDAK